MSEGTIKHKRQITQEEAESKTAEIGWREWNEGHVIELGSAKVFLGLDNDRHGVEAEDGNLYMAIDTREFYFYDTEWEPAFLNIIRSTPPPGKLRILNFWWDPDTKELSVETEEPKG